MHGLRSIVLCLAVLLSACRPDASSSSTPEAKQRFAAPGWPYATQNPDCERPTPEGVECDVIRTSLIRVIANPREFHGRKVEVTGWVHIEFESAGLYVSAEDARNELLRNGIWIGTPAQSVAFDQEIPNDRYVSFIGTFNAIEKGHMGQWSGTIDDYRFYDHSEIIEQARRAFPERRP